MKLPVHSMIWGYSSVSRLGSYEISEAEGVDRGTKVVIHLKGDCYDYSKEETVKGTEKKITNIEVCFDSCRNEDYFYICFTVYLREVRK